MSVLTPGDVVRNLRTARGWSQKVLADKIGVSDMTISKMERGITHLYRRDTLTKIAKAFGVTPDQLIAPRPPAAGTTTAAGERVKARLLLLFESLPPEHWAAAVQAVEIVVQWSAEIAQLRGELQTRQQRRSRTRRGRGAPAPPETDPPAVTPPAPLQRPTRGSDRRSVG